jgi:hypothetical protein
MWEDPYINKCASVIYKFTGHEKKKRAARGQSATNRAYGKQKRVSIS